MIQNNVTISQECCTVVHVHIFQSTKKFGFAVSFLPQMTTQQRERENEEKKRSYSPLHFLPETSVYIVNIKTRYFFSFMRLLPFFFFSNKTKFKGILITEL